MLIALLPNLKEIDLGNGLHDVNTLHWRTEHGFPFLRRLRAGDDKGPWPLALINTLLSKGRLETLQVRSASSWYVEYDVNLLNADDNYQFYPSAGISCL